LKRSFLPQRRLARLQGDLDDVRPGEEANEAAATVKADNKPAAIDLRYMDEFFSKK